MKHQPDVVLAGDIGGTNARFVLFIDGEYQHETFRAIPVADFTELGNVIESYQQIIGRQAIEQASFSVASTADYQDEINLTNADLRFSISDVRQRFSMQRVKVVNDFTAAALGVVYLADDSLRLLHPGTAEPDGPRAVIGPGTGLGVSGLLYAGNYWLPLQGQGGHVSIGANTDRELQIHRQLSARHGGHVSAERYLSGTGITGVYQSICQLDGITPEHQRAEAVTAAAIDGSCAVCVEVMELFCKYLGVVAGDLALTLGSSGGIYLAGGIVPKLGDFFIGSSFLEQLHNKGRFREFVAAMPVWLVTGGEPALHGAYSALSKHYNQLGHADSAQ